MTNISKLIVRKLSGEELTLASSELRSMVSEGSIGFSDFIFDTQLGSWSRVGDHSLFQKIFEQKPTVVPEKKLIYFWQTSVESSQGMVRGPFSLQEVKNNAASQGVCENTWVFVEGDKEWRKVKAVKAISSLLRPLPKERPVGAGMSSPASPSPASPSAVPPSAVPPAAPKLSLNAEKEVEQSNPSIALDLNEVTASETDISAADSDVPPPLPSSADSQPGKVSFSPMPEKTAEAISNSSADEHEREDITMAFSALGLSAELESAKKVEMPKAVPKLGSSTAAGGPPKPPPVASVPLKPTMPPAKLTKEKNDRDQGSYDGITAEISSDAIWLIKQGVSDNAVGPFRFLDIKKFLDEGKLSKNDKISKVGTNRFVKISQQYEFNVQFSVETVIERGVEKQKILIKRRHPRVPYISDVQVTCRLGLVVGSCVNLSAGGILLELPKSELNLGEVIEIKIMPAVIERAISCRALVIGKIPKIPPGYALKFENLKQEDKEAIEYFISEALKKEQLA
ncbi:MAG: PilZ domain-containing protein [Oligoflexia bacterium]|nr:PilZ domain-containing protein [Oligoflexia bacterium]